MIAFTGGRFLSTALMQHFNAALMLAAYAVASRMLCLAACMIRGPVAVGALTAVFFFESIMLPTIFALGRLPGFERRLSELALSRAP